MNFSYLTFSDGAKFALIAKNLINGNGFVTDFSFWGTNLFATNGIPALLPYLINIFFRIFGVNDFAVISFSFTFYIFLAISVFLLANKMFNKYVGVLSSLAVIFNYDYFRYALSGASETLFAFEIILTTYLLSFKKFWINVLGGLVIVAMYFSRPQAFIFILGLIFYWLINRFGFKKGSIYFLGIGFVGFLIDKLVIYPLSFKYGFLNPVFARGLQSILTYSSSSAVSDALRGSQSSTLGLIDVFKKVFYNLYNFYKFTPQIINPYLFLLFVIGLFKRGSKEFKVYSLFVTLATVLVTALTIPFYRYIHPVIPLIYIIGIGTLFEVLDVKLKNLIFVFLVIFFCFGQTLGIILLDSRFENKLHNLDKPPLHVILSEKIKLDTKKTDVIVTNLDTWGSWYGMRKTVWFPLEPEMVLNKNFDAIYLTSYKIDDANYYMGDNWRKIFMNADKKDVLSGYKLYKKYTVNKNENYENEEASAILFIKDE